MNSAIGSGSGSRDNHVSDYNMKESVVANAQGERIDNLSNLLTAIDRLKAIDEVLTCLYCKINGGVPEEALKNPTNFTPCLSDLMSNGPTEIHNRIDVALQLIKEIEDRIYG